MGASAPVQRALFEALGTLGHAVHDTPPQRPDGGGYPWIEIGVVVLVPFDTKDRNGFDFVARIHVRSDAHNMLPVKEIQDQIYDRLHHGDLTVAGYRLIHLQHEMSDILREAQGQIHGVSEYRGLIETM